LTWGQIPVREASQRLAENLRKLREYSWNTQTEVRVKGQQVSLTLEKFRYDLDGRLQIIPLGGTGKLSPELQPVVTDLVQLGLTYAQPSPEKFAEFYSRAEIWEGKAGAVRIEGTDGNLPGDHIDLRAKNGRADRLSVETIYRSATPVMIGAEYRSLPNDGPNYVARLEVSVPDEDIDVFVENFDYVLNQSVAASEISVIPQGTELRIRLTGPLSSKNASAGQDFQAVLDSDVVVDGTTVLKAGAPITGHVVESKAAARAQGKGRMAIRLTAVTVGSQPFALETNTLNFEAEGTGKKTGRRLLGGSGIGAAIGAIAGGGSGAWKGALIGAGVGGAATLVTKGNEVEFPAEQRFSFSLSRKLQIGG
jgi:hypothetical protein